MIGWKCPDAFTALYVDGMILSNRILNTDRLIKIAPKIDSKSVAYFLILSPYHLLNFEFSGKHNRTEGVRLPAF